MTSRPILFSAPMVRALLAGTKTQTRRIVKPQPSTNIRWGGWVTCSTARKNEGKAMWGEGEHLDRAHYVRCPYGQPGDRLWVRETHAIVPASAYACSRDGDQPIPHITHSDPGGRNHEWAIFAADWSRSAPGRWRPSIHMPRWASRITLEITGVRVERLQGINADDALAEGIEHDLDPRDREFRPGYYHGRAVGFYSRLWESINGPGSWDANPWVWVVEFRRVLP